MNNYLTIYMFTGGCLKFNVKCRIRRPLLRYDVNLSYTNSIVFYTFV